MEYTISCDHTKTVVDLKKEKIFGFAIGRKQINTTLVTWFIVLPLLAIEISITNKAMYNSIHNISKINEL